MQTQKKMTKRQRKALRGPNAMVRASLKNGDEQIVGRAIYLGKNPVYHVHPEMGIMKLAKGVPFVRAG